MTFKTLKASLIIASILASSQATAGEWDGFYMGASIVAGTGDSNLTYGSFSGDSAISGNLIGFHAGYNQSFKNFVLGAEFVAFSGSYDFDGNAYDTAVLGGDFNSMKDVKVRAGVDAGNFMPYLTAGYSSAVSTLVITDSTTGLTDSSTDYNLNGFSFGAGVDYIYNSSVIFGLEYLNRNLNGSDSGVDHDTQLNNLALRVSYLF